MNHPLDGRDFQRVLELMGSALILPNKKHCRIVIPSEAKHMGNLLFVNLQDLNSSKVLKNVGVGWIVRNCKVDPAYSFETDKKKDLEQLPSCP